MLSLSFFFRDHLSLVGRSNITRFSHPHDSFSVNSGLNGENAPVHRQRLTFAAIVRKRKKKKKKKNSKSRRRFEDGEKAPAAKRRKVPKRQYNVLHLHEDNLLRCMYGLDRPINQTITTSKPHQTGSSAFLCICRFGDWNFSFTATLATKTFRLLPPLRVVCLFVCFIMETLQAEASLQGIQVNHKLLPKWMYRRKRAEIARKLIPQ